MDKKTTYDRFPIGTPGKPWTDAERQQWRSTLKKERDYFTDVVSPLHRVSEQMHGCEVFVYGGLDYADLGFGRFPLFAARSAPWRPDLPAVAITGGVHGYETSGVHGALRFIQEKGIKDAADTFNVIVLPCVSPCGYECIHRWTPNAVDPNRQFKADATPGCDEARFAMAVIAKFAKASKFLALHMDLHETTDTDNSVFTPSRIARDGQSQLVEGDAGYEPYMTIPIGFYVFGDSARKRDQLDFSKFIISKVEKVTKIAEADAKGNLVGEPSQSKGVILAPGEGTADAHTDAAFVTTTEVYPDAEGVTPEECTRAQQAAIRAGIEYVRGVFEKEAAAAAAAATAATAAQK